jgi:hypothetical protein
VALYDAVGELELQIDAFATERRETAVSSEFVRVTTTVVLSGDGQVGQGEDVTYQAELHDDFPVLERRGRMTLDEYSQQVEADGNIGPFGSSSRRGWRSGRGSTSTRSSSSSSTRSARGATST